MEDGFIKMDLGTVLVGGSDDAMFDAMFSLTRA